MKVYSYNEFVNNKFPTFEDFRNEIKMQDATVDRMVNSGEIVSFMRYGSSQRAKIDFSLSSDLDSIVIFRDKLAVDSFFKKPIVREVPQEYQTFLLEEIKENPLKINILHHILFLSEKLGNGKGEDLKKLFGFGHEDISKDELKKYCFESLNHFKNSSLLKARLESKQEGKYERFLENILDKPIKASREMVRLHENGPYSQLHLSEREESRQCIVKWFCNLYEVPNDIIKGYERIFRLRDSYDSYLKHAVTGESISKKSLDNEYRDMLREIEEEFDTAYQIVDFARSKFLEVYGR